LSNFYLDEPRRIASRERDFGLWWRDGIDGPLHRAAWIWDTGELYMVRLGPSEDGGGEVEVLALAASLNEIERALSGWREACTRPESLRWLHARAARLREAPEPRPASGAPQPTPNARLAALLSVLIVGISPAAAIAQPRGGRGSYPRQSPPAKRASRSGKPAARTCAECGGPAYRVAGVVHCARCLRRDPPRGTPSG
jgi:hypothetical protein